MINGQRWRFSLQKNSGNKAHCKPIILRLDPGVVTKAVEIPVGDWMHKLSGAAHPESQFRIAKYFPSHSRAGIETVGSFAGPA
ncbi:MAG: hypothetical protein ACOX0K_10545 [Oscillospiraceae bacterium]